MQELAFDSPWQVLLHTTLRAAAAPPPGPAEKHEQAHPEEKDRGGSEPPRPADDPGVLPDGPKKYHDDYGSPPRQSARPERFVTEREAEGLPA
jgi:hypothetical protein